MTDFYSLLIFWLICLGIGAVCALICLIVFLTICRFAAKRFFKDD